MKTEKYICHSKIIVFHFRAKRREEYIGNLDKKKVNSHKIYRKTVKPYKSNEEFTLKENN